MKIKRMGVINITPNSFSDGGEFFSPETISKRLQFLKQFDAIDIGAESTAPKNAGVSWQTEWERWQMVLPLLKDITTTISADTYHPETIFELLKYWQDHQLQSKLIWNDVSGKFDDAVKDFLKSGHDYIFCHNLAPTRELTGQHMDYVAAEMDLQEYFRPHLHPQVILDPCLGFSKSYEQNWEIIENFGDIQRHIKHHRWLIGFSRKSFLRRKYSDDNNEVLDHMHVHEADRRTHRPECFSY
jgi:dihydropteroate synthase